MFGLNASLSLASQALQAQDGALGVTNNNIANVNTAGYSRQVVSLSAEALSQGGTSVDQGVSFGGFTSVRDELLQIGINQKTSASSSLDTQSSALKQVASAFSGTASGLGSAITNFFSGLSGLSTTPNDGAARQAALSAASQLVNAFHQASSSLASVSSTADQQIAPTVAQINQLSKQIADLNGQLATIQAAGQDGGSIADQRDQLTTQLSKLTGLSTTQTESGPTLSTGNGSPLVVGNNAYSLQVSRASDGLEHVFDAQGQDITATLSGGSLGGALTTRDSTVAGLTGKLNSFASDFASAINTAQASGYDQTGASGQPLFSISSNNAGSAAGITLSTSSLSAIAVSSDRSAGSSGNLSNLLAVQTTALPSGATPTDTYANLVFQIGSASSGAQNNLAATNLAMQQLTNQKASASGVSIDEESINLIRYQQAYTAAAKVISTIDQLYSVVMNMGSGGGGF
jgi:flagellar hook-associated protein 1 FlgK